MKTNFMFHKIIHFWWLGYKFWKLPARQKTPKTLSDWFPRGMFWLAQDLSKGRIFRSFLVRQNQFHFRWLSEKLSQYESDDSCLGYFSNLLKWNMAKIYRSQDRGKYKGPHIRVILKCCTVICINLWVISNDQDSNLSPLYKKILPWAVCVPTMAVNA